MRTSERLRKLKAWAKETLCDGREMKAPGQGMDLTDIRRKDPDCYLGWAPAWLDRTGDPTPKLIDSTDSVCPCIIIMPNQAYAKYMEEKRFDRYNNIHRSKQMGQQLSVQMLFGVYEPGIRLPGFLESAEESGKGVDISLLLEGTEQGLYTLLNWMDDCKQALLGQKMIPQTDLALDEESVTTSLYTDQNYVVDRRPMYYGFVNALFNCYADEGANPSTNQYLL